MRRLLIAAGFLALIGGSGTFPANAAAPHRVLPIAIEGNHLVDSMPLPRQPSPAEAAAIVAASETTESQCFGDDSTLTLALPSQDPAHPGSQDVVFFRETPADSTSKGTIWVAWDFLDSPLDDNTITCDQLAYLQEQLDSIVDTDVYYFGDYVQRPPGNEDIDIMVYNIVDQSYYDPEFPFRIAGFYSSQFQSEFNRNMVFVDTLAWDESLGPDAELEPFLIEKIVAHELQHLIHHDHDPGEYSWIDEGMADLAEFLNGYGHPESHVVYYLAFHRVSLTVWGGSLENYGAAYLFQLYLLENFGTKSGGTWDNTWTRTLIDEQGDSIAGVEAATGEDFDELFDAWILANYLDDPSRSAPSGFPLGYDEIDLTPFVSTTRFTPWSIARAINDTYGSDHHGELPISRYFGGFQSGTVEFPVGALPPYAGLFGSYAGFEPGLAVQVRGESQSGVPPLTGSYEMASGGGHLLTDRMLALNMPVGGSLEFDTWFDIEEEWDFGFVEASTDGGATWTKLPGDITRHSVNPNHSTAWTNALGSATEADTVITGSSLAVDDNGDGWVHGTFALPAASNVLVRFSYFTDEAVNGKGWFIDNVSADGFSDGFEGGPGNWTLGGWSWTTGLFSNDWAAGYINPVYSNGKLADIQVAYFGTEVTGPCSASNPAPCEFVTGTVDTSRLNRDRAVVFFTNRPAESVFDSDYRILVSKLPAK